MKPSNLKTKIFLDSGDPEETREAIALLGFLDGQTTNPSLIAKSPKAEERLKSGNKFSKTEVYDYYKAIVTEISALVPAGSVSVEVYGDASTTTEEMFAQGTEMFSWIPNAHIKYPTTKAGLEAAEKSIQAGQRVNMTLVFSESQAAAVYNATKNAKKGDVFLSPFIGRLDDIGENGMDFVKNVVELYKNGDGHVEVLAASVRSMDHFLTSIYYGADIITIPLKIIKEWVLAGLPMPDENYIYNSITLKAIAKEVIDLNADWKTQNIQHNLTDKGLEKFAADWNNLIQ